MTSIIKFIALSGVDGEAPPCYLLQVDEFKFLLDCGWDENFNMELIKNLKKHVQHLDAVFLSYPDLYHIGALPYLVGKMGLKCPIYATIPVFRMGQLSMYDVHQSRHNMEDFDLFTLDDVDMAFERVKQLTYNQSINVKGRIGTTLQITALPAGHMIGGTIWKIVKDDNEVIVYGVDYNHRKERHLDGCSFENIFRPHLFITDSFATDFAQSKRVSKDEQLSSTVSKTLRSGGNVLIPVDTCGRVLEVACLLEQLWKNQDTGLMAYNLVMLNCVTYNVLEFAKSLVEWMSDKVRKAMELQRTNHFQFKYLQICHTMAEFNRIPEPKVVLASTPDMESGFSRELFVQWCGNPNNSIVLTTRTSPGSLGRSLIDEPHQKKIALKLKRKVRLEGFELEEHRRREFHQKIEKVKVEETDDFEGGEEDDSSSDSDDDGWEDPCKTLRHGHDYAIKQQPKRKVSSYPKLFKRACPMFPYKKKKLRQSELGLDVNMKLFSKTPVSKYDNVSKQSTINSSNLATEVLEREDPPTKCVMTNQIVDVRANVTFIDFDGRSDVEFLKNIISQMKPLQMILVKSNDSSNEGITDFARFQMPPNGRILIPKLNEPLDSTMDSHVLQVKMSDALLSSFQLRKVKDYEVAWVDAVVTMETTKGDRDAALEDEEEEEVIPTLDVIPSEMVRPHDGVFANNLRLSEFKEILTRHGFKVEFCGGVLVINNKMKLKKDEAGCLIPEGVLCRELLPLMELIEKYFVVL